MSAISPRGPDGRGIAEHRHGDYDVVLGHTRLAIIDLSEHGRQPMEDEVSHWSITFNGEIYNYKELRQTLQSLGWAFHGSSDTEVLLKAWAQWKLDALPRLNGMFAFAVFNKITGEMWLVRDRFGVKPLLWGRTGDGMIFSSSVAAIGEVLSAGIDTVYCARALRYRVFETPGSEAPFQGVNAVQAGGWLRIQMETSGVRTTEGRWYDLKRAVAEKAAAIASSSDADVLGECRELLEDSVRLRLRSDVPVAISLSGGLDSSAVAATAARHVRDLKGFTYGHPDAHQSEGPLVAAFSRDVAIGCDYIWPKFEARQLGELLDRVMAFQEAPFGGLSVLAQNEVFRRVRESGFKVLLGGQGGDEAFAGYRKFFIVAARDSLRSRNVADVVRITYSLGQMLLAEVSQSKWYWQALRRYSGKKTFEFQLMDLETPAINLWGGPGTTLSERQELDILQWSLPSLLRYEDRNSMGHGVETRLPFLDYRLIELALALPTKLKIARGYGKWALRHMTKDTVPDFIRLTRKKRGFDVGQSWVEGGIGASLRSRIRDNRSTLAAYMKPEADLDRLLSEEALARDGNLLDEALMLAWLAKPIRSPRIERAAA